ncbi:hypothetical protein WQ57_06275 [Mesobacillus campisalis]|uniref:Uncharacterized protein n=1 Tax=Mesobacillus campisalis TaxID=1408103 RepID=A0A0M2SXQ0_9BACI|nr:hypothetical protein WQ57_06275 [Mesobacillus campisalis]
MGTVLLLQFWVASLPFVTALMKINGEIPITLGNTNVSRDLRGVFPLIFIKSLLFVLKKADNRKISAYFGLLDPCKLP